MAVCKVISPREGGRHSSLQCIHIRTPKMSLDVTHMQFVYTLQSLDNINFSIILVFILSEFDLKFTAIGTIKSKCGRLRI